MADGSVTELALADLSVTTDKLDIGAVAGEHLDINSISELKMRVASVGDPSIIPGVSSKKILSIFRREVFVLSGPATDFPLAKKIDGNDLLAFVSGAFKENVFDYTVTPGILPVGDTLKFVVPLDVPDRLVVFYKELP